MIAAIFLTFVAAVVACHLAWISDLLMVTIVLALLIVLIATDPAPSASVSPHRPPRLFFAKEATAVRTVE
jgi:hypothetical protein